MNNFSMSLADELELLYEMCAFEKYIYNRDDWCSFLTDTDRKIMEYRQDIQVMADHRLR